MMQITDHFAREEFDSHDGCQYPKGWIADRLKPLCNALEIIRALTGGPMHITSGYRTPEWNQSVGGAKDSQHVHGRAADIQLAGLQPVVLYAAIECLIAEGKLPPCGLGVYPRWVHIDLRGHNVRWRG
jgi:uncharacterized protein YcbK (DUF882 family)